MREITLSENSISQENINKSVLITIYSYLFALYHLSIEFYTMFITIFRFMASKRGIAGQTGLGLVGVIIGLFIALVVAEIKQVYTFNRLSSLTGQKVKDKIFLLPISGQYHTRINYGCKSSLNRFGRNMVIYFTYLPINHSGSDTLISRSCLATYSSRCSTSNIPKESVNKVKGIGI